MTHLDLEDLLQHYPLSIPEISGLPDMEMLGSALVHRYLSPHAGISTGAATGLQFPNATARWTPTNGVEAAHRAIANWRVDRGILRLVPDDEALTVYDDFAEDVPLLNGFKLPMADLLQRDRTLTLVLSSPNGISGQIAPLQEIIRLIRHFELVVIDERLAGFSLRRLTPLVVEWNNVISVQRFPFIMPGQTLPFGWMMHAPSLQSSILQHVEPLDSHAAAEALVYGAIDTWEAERLITRAKGQLFRELRKLSILSVPYPSWSNALLAHIERGDRNAIVQRLADRGIDVYSPPHANLTEHIRITAVSNETTMSLREALIQINLEI